MANSGASTAAKSFGPACSAVPADGAGSFSGMAKDPAATAASNNPVLSTTVAAVKAAGLVDTLNGPGPYTIFAPSNDAFAKIDKATLDTLLADPTGDLTKILTYHVVPGKFDADALVKAGTEKTVNGAEVKITKSGDTVKINDSSVVCGNIQTANATVYIIDSVMMPPAGGSTAAATTYPANFGPGCAAVPTSGSGSFSGMAKDPAATAASNNPALSTLVSTVKAAGLVDTLNGPGPYTIFAPSNDAFAKIDKATIDKLLADPSGDLTKILTYHVVPGKLDAAALVKAGTEKTVQGGSVKITTDGDTIKVNDAKVVCGNVETANATVYILDSVLMPM
jgi:uncharacterized surface protein with fasciclin (FAS1) repeats